jgi:hypothetical protein
MSDPADEVAREEAQVEASSGHFDETQGVQK